ncbi:MAG: protein kinase, partial [Nannocystaceae bacterium]
MVDELHDAATLMADRSEVVDADETLLSADGPRSRVKTRLRRGDLVGRYVVLDQLGEGGMGVVYAAFDPELERRVALKLVKPEPGFSSRGSAGQPRLLREAQALAKLTHPNVVSVYDVGAWQQSVFVAMEFVDGETAAQWIRRRHEHGLPSWREVLSVFVPAGRGLEAAHASGIV